MYPQTAPSGGSTRDAHDRSLPHGTATNEETSGEQTAAADGGDPGPKARRPTTAPTCLQQASWRLAPAGSPTAQVDRREPTAVSGATFHARGHTDGGTRFS